MKRSIAIVLAYLFLQSNVGLSLVKHYCGDFLAQQNLGLFASETSCGMEADPGSCEKPDQDEANGCCHNEVEKLQVDDSLKAPVLASVDFIPFVLFLITFAFGNFRLRIATNEVALSGHSPPHRFTHLRFRAFLQIFRN
ncbi:MAG: hypothetical protein H7Z75_15015 [Ferruginibacter sp.]|nr:hypothetical protein [Cytophagales bacterium]